MFQNKDIKIFIVEDDKFYANLVREKLKLSNFQNVIIFETGESFIDNLFRNPDVVILDYSLGNTNGLDLLKKIKSVNPDIQVIFLSGQEEMNVAINSLKYGAFDYLEKDEESLERLVFILMRIVQHNQFASESKRFKFFKKAVYFGLACIVGVIFYLSGHLDWHN